MVEVEPYWLRVKRLRTEKGLTEDDLVRRSNLSRSSVQALQRPYQPMRNGQGSTSRYPRPDKLEAIAAALGVDPDEFPEWRLAQIRDMLDDRKAGLATALANLDHIIDGLGALQASRTATEAEPPVLLRALRPATDDAHATAREAE